MICAVASGKGGTGKTTVTASLASLWAAKGEVPLTVVDLDVEEPNLHLFLHPRIASNDPALLEVPVLDPERCTLCGQCAEFCRYKALSVMGAKLLVFPDMCHGCGGCLRLCPEGALRPAGRELGHVVEGRAFEGVAEGPAGGARFLMGRLRVGEAMSPPLMRAVRAKLGNAPGDVLIDSPPGVSCPAVNAVSGADVIVLVTEPTPFGLHDLRLAVEAFRPLCRAMGVVVNRATDGCGPVRDYCREAGLPIWAELPQSRAAAEAYSRGEVLAASLPEMAQAFSDLSQAIKTAARGCDHA